MISSREEDSSPVRNLHPKGLARAAAFAPTYRAWLAEWPLQPQQRVVDTRTGRTHLLVWGPADAPPLVVLHGAGASGLSWVYQAEAFAVHNRVYALDIPGHYGLSVSAKPQRTMADIVTWLDEVLDALQLSRVDLLGHSFGGQVALYYALHAPARLQRLILMAPGALFPLRMAYLLRAMTVLFGTRAATDRLLRYLGSHANDHQEPYEARLRRAVDMSMIVSRHFGLLQMPFPSTLRNEELRALSIPTLLVIGEQEVIYDARKAMARATTLIPKVQTVLLPGAGHLMNLSHAEQLHAAIAAFLTS
jgi:pimeloyl-ACP methyl ester carboxylesterase